MKRLFSNRKMFLVVAGSLALTAIGATQIKEVIKIVGVGAAVSRFGPDINRAINKLTKHEDTNTKFTKVVPILTIGINTRGTKNAIGAAQVMGSKSAVEQVQAVASPEAGLFGNEIRIRALIPVSTKTPDASNLKAVDGVGVSGIVDLKL